LTKPQIYGDHSAVKRRLRKLQTYVSRCLPMLLLTDWRVTVREGDEWVSEHSYAAMRQDDDQWIATIEIGEDFWRLSPDEKREVVAHELVHCHTYPVQQRVLGVLKIALTKKPYAITESLINSDIELMTDNMARSVAAMLPKWKD
jgi:hypothetical protein